MEFNHTSVLLTETIENLNIRPEGIYVDGTLGGGGHAAEVLKRLDGKGRLIGFDQDADAIAAAGERLKEYGERLTTIRSNYENMTEELGRLGITGVDGIVLDLGVSSFQFDTPGRGFTYRVEDAPLDMRMDQRASISAHEIINDYSEGELYRIIRDYGEDRFAKNIAKHIVAARAKAPIETTGQLNEIIAAAIPKKVAKTGGHPAGRICIITFHSLEDRIVKTIFRQNENPCTCPPDFPVCVCGNVSKGRIITRKPILPSEEEMEANPRSKSAKLRVFERGEG
jgi:16S rRNA (cytosine1402-N4)-methyltransferase